MTSQDCRGCHGSNLVQILDLGFAPPSNSLLSREDLSKGEIHYPLVLLFCQDCKLVQTMDFHPSEALFTRDYPYLSSTSTSWIQHSHALVDRLIEEFQLDENSLVAEIASNDGYLLERLKQKSIPAYGVEPTEVAAEISIKKGHRVYNFFLNPESAAEIRKGQRAADVVIANNVFAHVPNLHDFTESVKLLLSNDGILVIEVQDFSQLFDSVLFDTIYHEHFSYFSLTSLNNFLSHHDLFIFRAEYLQTHGGSIRAYVRKRNGSNDSLASMVSLSLKEKNATDLSLLMSLQDSVEQKKIKIRSFFHDQVSKSNNVIGIGAAAKGNTLINFVGLDKTDIRFVCDSATSKHGKFLPGSHLPIYPLDESYLNEAQTIVILPWNLSNELLDLVNRIRKQDDFEVYELLPKIRQIYSRKS